MPYIELKQPIYTKPDLKIIEEEIKKNNEQGKKIGYVYMTHHETVSGLLHPITQSMFIKIISIS